MQMENGQSSPNLKELCLEYYVFDPRRLNLVQQQVRFSLLTSLELKACTHVVDLLQSIPDAPESIRLKALKIDNAKGYTNWPRIFPQRCYSDFLTSFEGLEELALNDYRLDQDFVRSIVSHGTTLRFESLRYISTSRSNRDCRDLLDFSGYSELDLPSLLELRDNCRDLQVLHLDLLYVESNLEVGRSCLWRCSLANGKSLVA